MSDPICWTIRRFGPDGVWSTSTVWWCRPTRSAQARIPMAVTGHIGVPRVGEHTRMVLLAAGVSAAEVDRLVDEGVVSE